MARTVVLTILVALAIIAAVFLYYNLSSPLAIYPEDAKAMLAKGGFDHVIDVRTDVEWNAGHFPLAIHIPTARLETDLPLRIPNKASKLLFYCNTSTRSRMAAEAAQKLGYPNVRYLVGTHVNLLK